MCPCSPCIFGLTWCSLTGSLSSSTTIPHHVDVGSFHAESVQQPSVRETMRTSGGRGSQRQQAASFRPRLSYRHWRPKYALFEWTHRRGVRMKKGRWNYGTRSHGMPLRRLTFTRFMFTRTAFHLNQQSAPILVNVGLSSPCLFCAIAPGNQGD